MAAPRAANAQLAQRREIRCQINVNGKNRSMGYFATEPERKQALMQQWASLAMMSQRQLLRLEVQEGEAAAFQDHARRARDRLAAELGVNPAEVEGRDWLLAKILAAREQTTP